VEDLCFGQPQLGQEGTWDLRGQDLPVGQPQLDPEGRQDLSGKDLGVGQPKLNQEGGRDLSFLSVFSFPSVYGSILFLFLSCSLEDDADDKNDKNGADGAEKYPANSLGDVGDDASGPAAVENLLFTRNVHLTLLNPCFVFLHDVTMFAPLLTPLRSQSDDTMFVSSANGRIGFMSGPLT
jgi:hypothetical protein